MNTGMILHTFLGLLLLLIPAGALYVLERKMLQPFAVAVARMMGQGLVLCLMVWVLIKVDSLWLLLVWLLAMSGFSAVLVLKRCNLDVRKLLIAVASGLYVGVFLVGLWLLGLVLPVSVFYVRWFVPVMALLTGHATVMMIRGLNTYVSALRTDEQQYEFLRGNGQSHLKALLPFLRRHQLVSRILATCNRQRRMPQTGAAAAFLSRRARSCSSWAVRCSRCAVSRSKSVKVFR